jgi:hypothetical protein
VEPSHHVEQKMYHLMDLKFIFMTLTLYNSSNSYCILTKQNYHFMDLKFANSSRNNSVWTRSTIMDPLLDVVCSRGYDQSMTYIPTFCNIIAKRFKLTMGKINYKWNDNIYY